MIHSSPVPTPPAAASSPPRKTPVMIDHVEYFYEDLTPSQQNLVNHVADLDRKLQVAQFNLEEVQVSRDAFFSLLKAALQPLTTMPPDALEIPKAPAALTTPPCSTQFTQQNQYDAYMQRSDKRS